MHAIAPPYRRYVYVYYVFPLVCGGCFTPRFYPDKSVESADKVIFVGRLVEAGDVVSPLAGAELVCTWPLPTTLLSNIAV